MKSVPGYNYTLLPDCHDCSVVACSIMQVSICHTVTLTTPPLPPQLVSVDIMLQG